MVIQFYWLKPFPEVTNISFRFCKICQLKVQLWTLHEVSINSGTSKNRHQCCYIKIIVWFLTAYCFNNNIRQSTWYTVNDKFGQTRVKTYSCSKSLLINLASKQNETLTKSTKTNKKKTYLKGIATKNFQIPVWGLNWKIKYKIYVRLIISAHLYLHSSNI